MPVSANSPCRKVGGPPTGGDGRCLYPAFRETLPGGRSFIVLDQVSGGPADDFPATRVPAGHLFLMGDNRDDSLDSRFAPVEGGIGLVPLENVVGRGQAIFWSTDGGSSYWQPWTWFSALRTDRVATGVRPMNGDLAAFLADELGHKVKDHGDVRSGAHPFERARRQL